MHRIILLLSLSILAEITVSAQDTSLAFLKKELIRIDSIVKSVENNKQLKSTPVIGASAVRKEYNGIAYQYPKSLELQKLSIIPRSSGEEQTIYLTSQKILKIKLETGEYYAISNSYYNNHLDKIISPPLLENFSDIEDILKIVSKILPHINK